MRPCKCGCGELVGGRRWFVNQDHELAWRIDGGARQSNALSSREERGPGGTTTLTAAEAARHLGIRVSQLAALVRRGVVTASVNSSSERPSFNGDQLPPLQRALEHLKWLAVVSPENWEMLTDNGLTFTMFPAERRPWLKLMRPGNEILFYITRFSVIAGLAEVVGKVEARSVRMPGGIYELRVPLRPRFTSEPAKGAKILPLVPQLSFIRNKDEWGMSFHHTLFALSDSDFGLIAGGLTGAAPTASVPATSPASRSSSPASRVEPTTAARPELR
jgi:hypothetical protein